MVRTVYCQNCGCQMDESLQFCTNCGSKVGMPAAPVVAAPAGQQPAQQGQRCLDPQGQPYAQTSLNPQGQAHAQNSLAAQPQQHAQNSLAAQPQQHAQNSLAAQPQQHAQRSLDPQTVLAAQPAPQTAPRPVAVEAPQKKIKAGLIIVLIAIVAALAVAAVLLLPKLLGGEDKEKPEATDGASVQTEGAGTTESTPEAPAEVSETLMLEKPTLKLEICQRDVLWYTMDGTAADIEWTCAKNQLAEGKNPKWSTSDKSVATVDKNGMVVGVGAGQCQIILDIDGEKTVCNVTVENSTEGIDLAAGTWTLGFYWMDYGEEEMLQGWTLVLNEDTTGVLRSADGKEMQIVWYYDEAHDEELYLYEIYVDGHRCGGRLDLTFGIAEPRFEIIDGAKGAAFFQ